METLKSTTTPSVSDNTVEAPKSNWKTPAIIGALLSLLGANAVLFTKSAGIENEMNRLRHSTSTEMTAMKQTATAHEQSSQKTIDELRDQLTAAKTDAQKAAASAALQARTNADKAAKQAEQATKMASDLAEAQKVSAEAQAKLAESLGAVKQTTDANVTKVGEAFTEIGNVKTEVAATKSTLDSTISELRSVKGDLGVQSGLIATNSKELDALKQLGERNYFEFNITKSNGMVKVGGIAMELRKADLKRNKFNLFVLADDKRVEKKDKTVNEPVQFYVQGGKQPLEVVVNEIQKDRIVGYLATPKVIQARR
ncbi:MAG: hypothetical protein U0Q16_32245 [Bryobacteraceae bacterium]